MAKQYEDKFKEDKYRHMSKESVKGNIITIISKQTTS